LKIKVLFYLNLFSVHCGIPEYCSQDLNLAMRRSHSAHITKQPLQPGLFILKTFFCFLLLGASFSGKAQVNNGRFEIGLTGGIQGYYYSSGSPANTGSGLGFNRQGSVFIRYAADSIWKLGFTVGIDNWSVRNNAAQQENGISTGTFKEVTMRASPMLSFMPTLTRVLHTGLWQSAVTVRAGFAITLSKAPADSLFTPARPPEETSHVSGNGFVAGIQFEESRMLSRTIGIRGTLGLNYYRIFWRDVSFESYDVVNNLFSVPVSLGLFARF
jgi:hypothetical protein